MAVLTYRDYTRIPVVSFGYWAETVMKWADEGHIGREEAINYVEAGDNSEGDKAIMKKLGFDMFLIGESVAPGVPVMVPVACRELKLVLKSGNFGQLDFFTRALKILRGK